jgi:hypothetical protein
MINILVVIPAKRDPVWFTLHTALIRVVVVQVMTALVSVQHIRQDSPKPSSGLRRSLNQYILHIIGIQLCLAVSLY